MFGYVRPEKGELKIKEYELYQSAYCGLCSVMGRRYSYVYKMSLSYDFVFLVLLRLYILPEKVSFSQKRCIAHPTKKKTMMDNNSALELSADVGLIMLYHNFLDKINDRDGAKWMLCRLLMPELKRLRKKACADERIARFDREVKEHLDRLSEMEKSNTQSVDMPAEEFGAVLGRALALGLEGSTARAAFEIGRNIGKWIYVVDALDDIDRDEKSKKYNPFIASFESAEKAKEMGGIIRRSLLNTLAAADNAFGLLDNTDGGVYNILTNIIRLGTVGQHEKILINNNFKEI